MTANFLLGLFLLILLWHFIVGDLGGSGNVFEYEQQMDNISNENSKMQDVVIAQDPFLYYLDYKTVYMNCSVYGESPFEVSWLYSTDEISNRSSGYTIISGSKVSNIVYNPNSDDEGYVLWNSSLLLNPINNSTVGYYYCRVNTSFGPIYSKPVYIKKPYLPRLSSTKFNKIGGMVLGTWRVISFPLPNILISFQYLSANSLGLYRKRVYNGYMTANVSENFYSTSHHFTYVNKTSDNSLTVHWRFPFQQLFSMRLIAISYDDLSQKAHHHKLYNHSGQAYVNFLSLFHHELKVTFSCLCGECDDIEWRRDNVPLPQSSYGVVALKKELWPYHSINLKHSILSTSYYDRTHYSCHTVNSQDDIFENSPAYIDNPFAEIIEQPENAAYAVSGETLTLKCSARSLYPMTVRWHESRFLFAIKVVTNSFKQEGFYNELNSTMSVKISLLTPFSFRMWCIFTTNIYFQPDNFTKGHGLFQTGIIFEKPQIINPYVTSVHSVVTIQHPSSITSNVTSITINETEKMYLWCFATGIPQPTIIWYHNSRQLHSNSYLTITNPSAQQSAVIILQTRYERDKGTYTCEARNNVTNLIKAKQSHNITVNIQVAPEIELPQNITAYESDNVTITVKVVRAHPPVLPDHISWTYWTTSSNGSMTIPTIEEGYDSRVNISEDSTSLYISDLTSDDEGYYQVLIWHQTGYKNKTTYLKIESPTEGTTASTSTQYTTTISTSLGLGMTIIILCIVIVSIIVYKKKRNKKDQIMRDLFEMENNGRRRSSALTNTAQICLNATDPNFLKALPLLLLIKRSNLKLLDCIGQGEFAKVYKGHYYINGECSLVAVKALKGIMDRYDSNDMKDLIEESLVMKDLQHPNVMGLIGICLDAGPSPLIVLPYMEGGSLLKYLVKNRDILMTSTSTDNDEINQVRSQLLSICLQIGKGMQYIVENNLIHRDLAARNCMIDATGNVKVADFGLSKNVSGNIYFRQQMSSGVKLPIKWMAIESIEDGIFTEKTDIWSFGITVWEVFNEGKTPYGGFSPTCVKTMISDGYRLEAPSNSACNDNIYQKTMLKCWERDPNERPTFAQVVTDIDTLLSNSVGYLDLTL
ncbi:PREDICTED: fibroblast growth factor receptor 4-like isoform X2 [Amphimedon queenslandica]|uniref:receptor protein-tyrosine kinase n=1 Tax=Amphimedon queenslandica TaxID=400682 RepID=A0AAN0JIY1_AMPQE|nr:PREDICTED: fibroblast growth factor receptor 4-like isoform X2 [Amphimedon queenslandica]|eukprot:XP_019856980.1 PREDICTED: fibroblast growth factor receptor 4-like isoform X2 [Amphimedon queenslandica]